MRHSGFMIWHMNRSPHVIAHLDTMDEVRKWFIDNPHAHSAYYSVTNAFIHTSQYKRKDES